MVPHREQRDVWVQRSHLVLVIVVFLSFGAYMYHSHMEMNKELQQVRKQAANFKSRVYTGLLCYEQMTAFVNVLESLVSEQDNKTNTEHVYSGLGSLMGLGRGKRKGAGKEAFNYARCQAHMGEIMRELRGGGGLQSNSLTTHAARRSRQLALLLGTKMATTTSYELNLWCHVDVIILEYIYPFLSLSQHNFLPRI